MPHHQMPEIRAHSEVSVVLCFGNEISEEILQDITNWNTTLNTRRFPGFIESVPAYVTITVYYDPVQVMKENIAKGAHPSSKVINYIHSLRKRPARRSLHSELLVVIPVCYDLEFGPDLEETAAYHQISIKELIARHTEPIYRVHMIGFMPGFPYLGGMNKSIATPRKNTPRTLVPAGSVGIGGEQTGIYPLSSPGGWQLIGRTPLKLFDAEKNPPVLLRTGVSVKFSSISRDTFNEFIQ